MSPALEGGFFTTGPPGKSPIAHFFLMLNNIPLSDGLQFIYLLTEGHLGCFQVLATVSHNLLPQK